VLPFFDPSVHGDPIFSLDSNGKKVLHPKYDDVSRFYTNTPPGQAIPHFYSVYQKPGRTPRLYSTKDALSQAQRQLTDATRLSWDCMLTTFMYHTRASPQLARVYLQYYRDAELAVQAFFDDAAEREKPADDDAKVLHSKLTKAAIAAAVEAGNDAIAAAAAAAADAAAATTAIAAAAAVATPVLDIMEEDVEAGAFISAPQPDMVLTEKIALFCQCTNQTSALACQYIEMFPGPVQLAIDAFICHNEQDGTAAQMPPRGAGGGNGVSAAQGGAATNMHSGYVDADGEGRLDAFNGRRRQQPASTVAPSHLTPKPRLEPPVPSEASIKEFQRLSGEYLRRSAIVYLHEHGSPRAAAEAWLLGEDINEDMEDDEKLNDAAVQTVPVTADRGLVLQFMGTTDADVVTTESYLVRFHNNIVNAVTAYWRDKEAMSMDVNGEPAATCV